MFRTTLALLILAVVPATAQWLDYKTPGIPRLRDGKPNLSAPAPRTFRPAAEYQAVHTVI